jgi:hypothetical protein
MKLLFTCNFFEGKKLLSVFSTKARQDQIPGWVIDYSLKDCYYPRDARAT